VKLRFEHIIKLKNIKFLGTVKSKKGEKISSHMFFTLKRRRWRREWGKMCWGKKCGKIKDSISVFRAVDLPHIFTLRGRNAYVTLLDSLMRFLIIFSKIC
jgi:hypothetical protein